MSSPIKWLLKMDLYPEFEIHSVSFDPHNASAVPTAGKGTHTPPHLLGDGISFYVDDFSVGMQLHQGDTSGQHYEQAKLRLIEPGSRGGFARYELISCRTFWSNIPNLAVTPGTATARAGMSSLAVNRAA